ncbi:hypothetical protein PIB30_091167 [Stylosanthes scabra]|uniref:Uncharacterized protein n=1 Tax=Stylosanthes scabra TaxID=79078 RepID=A0ABU6YS90_9FABA|nr:hypothetical protein [Stylosanthes scabra]
MPVNSWIKEDDERTAYHERLSVMEILVPKHLVDNVLLEEEYPESWRLIDVQKVRQFSFMRERYFPRFVAAAYTTISIHDTLKADGTSEFRFHFKLGGREYTLTLQHLANIWGLKNEETTFKSGSNPHRTWDKFDKLDVARVLHLGPAAGEKYPISRMTMDNCFLLYVLSYVLPPARGITARRWRRISPSFGLWRRENRSTGRT